MGSGYSVSDSSSFYAKFLGDDEGAATPPETTPPAADAVEEDRAPARGSDGAAHRAEETTSVVPRTVLPPAGVAPTEPGEPGTAGSAGHGSEGTTPPAGPAPVAGEDRTRPVGAGGPFGGASGRGPFGGYGRGGEAAPRHSAAAEPGRGAAAAAEPGRGGPPPAPPVLPPGYGPRPWAPGGYPPPGSAAGPGPNGYLGAPSTQSSGAHVPPQYRPPVAPGEPRRDSDGSPPPPRTDIAPPSGGYPAPPVAGYGGQQGPPGEYGNPSVGQLRANIRPADLIKPYKEVPELGWRKALYKSTRINAGLSPAERRWIDLRHRVGRNLRGTYLVAVLQEKGGVGKTTVTVGVGSALARYRDDKIVGIDANPASGNLAKRIDEPSQGTWRGLISDARLESYSDFRHYLGKSSSSGFEVLAGDRGDQVLTGVELRELWRRLQRQYPVGLIDCGTQMRDDVMAAVLSIVDAVLVVSTTRLDGAGSAADTLNWLVEHGYPHFARNAVVVISDVSKVSENSAVSKLHEQFEKAVRAVHHVPFDPHLSDATAIDFDRLRPDTRRAFIEAAASMVDGFAGAADKDPGALGAAWSDRDLR
jgi:MinD-like ATPase involved in chromosome partitioning or flagellar assembly